MIATSNTMTAKIFAALAVAGLVASSVIAFAPAAGAQTTTTTTTTTSASVSFSRDLTIGSTGADVTALQNWLISKGHGIAAGATGYFGMQTKAALAAYQAANGISPAVGYFGPITRAKVNAGGTTSGGGTGTGTGTGTGSGLSGGEGELDVNGNLGDVESDVDEGEEEVNVLGVELEAKDSDIMIERVDVDFTLSGTGSSNLDDYVTEVHLVLDGDVIASLDVDEGDEDTNNVFSFRFNDLEGVIDEDDTAELYVAVTAVNNVDTGDVAKVISVDFPANAIRAVDAEDISETYMTAGEVTAETFNVTAATTGDVDVSLSTESPDAAIVIVDDTEDTDDLTIMSFDVEANDQEIEITDLPVGLFTSESNVSGQVKRVKLVHDGDVLDTVSITGTGAYFQAVFEDLDLVIDEDDTITLDVVVDLNDQETTSFDNGTTLSATTTGSNAAWDVEDANGEDVTPDGAAQGDTMTFYASGIAVAGDEEDNSAEDSAFGTSGSEQADFTIVFDVSAVEEDYYIYKGASTASSTTSGVTYTVYQDGSASTTVESAGFATDNLTAETQTGDTSDYFLVREGDTRTFTLRVNLNPSTTGFYFLELEAVRYDASEDNASTDDETLTVPDEEDFETEAIQVNG